MGHKVFSYLSASASNPADVAIEQQTLALHRAYATVLNQISVRGL